MAKDRYKIITAVYLILLKDGKMPLLLRQNTGWMDGSYSLISGHVEYGETLKEAMIREALEEAGITLTKEALDLVYTQHRPDLTSPGDERLDFFFTCTSWEGTVSNQEPDKCVSIDWFDPEYLPKNTVHYTRAALEHYKSTNYEEYEWDQL